MERREGKFRGINQSSKGWKKKRQKQQEEKKKEKTRTHRPQWGGNMQNKMHVEEIQCTNRIERMHSLVVENKYVESERVRRR